MSTILIVSVIILQQQGEHIIYPIITTATREEDEHIIATPSYELFLLSDRNSANIKKDQHEEANGKHLPSLTNKSITNSKRILIVENEPDITLCFKMALENHGFREQVDAYNDPSIALSAFSPGSYVPGFDIIFSLERQGRMLRILYRHWQTPISMKLPSCPDLMLPTCTQVSLTKSIHSKSCQIEMAK